MRLALLADGLERQDRIGTSVKRAGPNDANACARFVDFGDRESRLSIEGAMQGGLGDACTLDLDIDDDILAFPGDTDELRDILGAVAREARLTMADGGVLHLCALNVFDRCGGDRDQVMIVVSYTAARGDGLGIANGSGLGRATTFAATRNAESELSRDDRAETVLCLVHPTAGPREPA